MSEAEESLIETNPEEDISKEVSETDYTEETGQENDFDVADLECVDEEEAERSEDRGRIKEASPKRSLRGNRFSDHRHEPYKRPHRSSESLKKNKNSPSKLNRDQQRKRNYLERKKNEKAANSVTDIDFDELEEIDSYEYEDQDNNFATPSTTSGTTESASATPVLDYTDNDEHDDWGRLQENGTDLQSDEEDFPTLSEDIDADVLEQITQENIALLVNSTQPNKLNDSEPSERQNVDLLTPPETSKTNGDIKEISNHGASTKKLDDEGLEQESRQSRIDKEARLKKWKSPEEKLKELKKRKRKIDDQQERQTESASPSSHKSGQRCISEERTTRDDSPSKGYHDRQVGGRRRGRDDDILPPSRKQIRNLLDQLVERNNRIRREEKSEERRKTSHHEENGESTKSGTKSHAHSESRPSPQS